MCIKVGSAPCLYSRALPLRNPSSTMRSFSTTTILAAIGAVGAAPAPASYINSARSDNDTAKAYTPVVWNTTAVVDGINIHNMPIQARDGAFKVGGDAAGVCPVCDQSRRICLTVILTMLPHKVIRPQLFLSEQDHHLSRWQQNHVDGHPRLLWPTGRCRRWSELAVHATQNLP